MYECTSHVFGGVDKLVLQITLLCFAWISDPPRILEHTMFNIERLGFFGSCVVFMLLCVVPLAFLKSPIQGWHPETFRDLTALSARADGGA